MECGISLRLPDEHVLLCVKEHLPYWNAALSRASLVDMYSEYTSGVLKEYSTYHTGMLPWVGPPWWTCTLSTPLVC
jgi:hypothetical protein